MFRLTPPQLPLLLSFLSFVSQKSLLAIPSSLVVSVLGRFSYPMRLPVSTEAAGISAGGIYQVQGESGKPHRTEICRGRRPGLCVALLLAGALGGSRVLSTYGTQATRLQ